MPFYKGQYKMNLQEINELIEELESVDTTSINCVNLASLYIIRDNLKQGYLKLAEPQSAIVEKELSDILPQYKEYVDIKTKYQLGEVGEAIVIKRLRGVCKELEEFIRILYSSTDLPEERKWIENTIKNLQSIRG